MKTLVTLAIATLALLGAAPQAEARGHSTRVYISGYRSCGTPIYSERYFIGYDCHRRPIWGTRVVHRHYVAPCPPPRCAPRPPRHCPPPRRDHHNHDSRIVIQGNFRL